MATHGGHQYMIRNKMYKSEMIKKKALGEIHYPFSDDKRTCKHGKVNIFSQNST